MSEATERYERIRDAVEWPKDAHGYIAFAAEKAHDAATLWALRQLTRDEYFALDILERLKAAMTSIRSADLDNRIDAGGPCTVDDVLHDAIVEIRRLRGELPPKEAA